MSKTSVIDRATLIGWVLKFVRTPSPQTDLFEREPQVLNFIGGPVADILTQNGLSWRRDPMGNLLVEIGPETSEKSLMFMAYAMTHPANRMENPFSGELVDKGSRIRGRGVSEQKGALAAAIAAVVAAKDSALKSRVVLAISTAGETGRHDAAKSIIEMLGYVPTATVIAIGTTSRLALANKGRIDVEITVKGHASHSSTPWAGIDAIAGARKVLDRVLEIDVGRHTHPQLGNATLTATSIRSWPEATHTLQDEVKLVFDRRLLPAENYDEAFAEIANAADIGAPWKVETVLGPTMYPAEISRDGPLGRAVSEGCGKQSVPIPDPFYSSGALDAGLFHSLDKEAAMWGPGDQALWHSENESLAIEDLINGAYSYLGLINAYAGR